MTSAAQRPAKTTSASVVPSVQSAHPVPVEQLLDITTLPAELYSDEPPLETDLHLRQILILLTCLELIWEERNDFYATGNSTVYYSPKKIKSRDFRGPDFFMVLNTERRPRKSWVLWEEDYKYPNLVVEILSDSTAQVDRTTKKDLYQDIWRVPEYFWFDPGSLEFEGFSLINGAYQSIEVTEAGWRWSEQLGLYLGLHQDKLRYFDAQGELVPTPEENAKQARIESVEAKAEVAEAKAEVAEAKAEVAEAKAEVAEAKAEAEGLRQKLRSLGIDPDAD